MTLFISLKEKVANALQNQDLGNIFRQIENYINSPQQVISCGYTRATAWTTILGPFTALAYDNLVWDRFKLYNPSTGVFTPNVGGVWHFDMFGGAGSTAVAQVFEAALGVIAYGSPGISVVAGNPLWSMLSITVSLAKGQAVTSGYSCSTTGLTGLTGSGAFFRANFLGTI